MIANAVFWSLFEARLAIFKQARDKLTLPNTVDFLLT